MFTGIIQAIGHIAGIDARGGDVRMSVDTGTLDLSDVTQGDSIAVNGVCLTVNKVEGAVFELNIIPHTLQQTILEDCREGAQVNLEVDLIARYLERLMLGEQTAGAESGGVTESLLKARGFIR